jgi:hypothetical protein
MKLEVRAFSILFVLHLHLQMIIEKRLGVSLISAIRRKPTIFIEYRLFFDDRFAEASLDCWSKVLTVCKTRRHDSH